MTNNKKEEETHTQPTKTRWVKPVITRRSADNTLGGTKADTVDNFTPNSYKNGS